MLCILNINFQIFQIFVVSVLDMFAGRSRSTTPASLISGKSSTADQGVQVSGVCKRDDKKIVHPIQPPGGQRGQHYQQQRERRDSRGEQNPVRT